MKLGGFAAQRCHGHSVLEEPAGVRVMGFRGRRQDAQTGANPGVSGEAGDEVLEPGMRDLRC